VQLQVSPADYERLAKFRLSRRWIDAMPPDTYFKIHPLKAAKAKEVSKQAYSLLEGWQPKPALFQTEPQFDASGEREPGTEWLLQRETDRAQQAVLVWNESTAALTEWGIFCDFWDDFCYPSSDDVVVLPLTCHWVLLYDHEETLQFGRLKT
jgi:hypothetical protein